jgi:hypothetical protein
MGLFSFLKKVWSGDDEVDEEVRAARARHGIVVREDEKSRQELKKPEMEDYDPWEDIRNIRSNFFIGGWAAKKFRIIGEDKVKKQLEELAKKREEEERRRKEEGEG